MQTSISEILATRKVKDRSDQFLILAALYSLGAEHTPVAPKAIKERLKLHKARIPANLNVSLRRCEGLVDPVEGEPVLWRLLSRGLEKLRDLSGLALVADVREEEFSSDVGFVCALEHLEFEALRDALGGASAWKETGDKRYAHVYRETTLTTASGKTLRLVATVSTSMGLTAAAIATSQLIAQFKPRIVLMVGIAAGTRASNRQFGDVLVADPSVDYNSGKVIWEGDITGFLPDPYPIGLHPRLRTVLRRYATDQAVFERIRQKWVGVMPPSNRAHIGTVGAADQVIDNPQVILELQKHWRKLIGVEMETYAVYRACSEAPEPQPRFASFKAVCDFAAEKTDSWQAYAAFMAAEFTVGFLRTQWDSLWAEK